MIRLLDVKQIVNEGRYKHLDEKELKYQQIVPYVILSHRWMEHEFIYEDLEQSSSLRS